MTEPASVTSDGMVKVVWVEEIEDVDAPGLSELNAASSEDLSCYFTDTGWGPDTDEATVTDNRLCSRQTFARAGRFADSLEVGYVYNPLVPLEDVARLTLTHLTEGFLVARWGDNFEDDFQVGDIVDVYPVQCGIQRKQPPTMNTPLTISQNMFVRAPGVQRDVVVAAS